MSMSQRRDEILAKKAKLAELKRQRELRANQGAGGRHSLAPGELIPPTPGQADKQREIESLINSLVGESRPVSTSTGGVASPARRGSRPNSVLSAEELSNENSEIIVPSTSTSTPSQPQVLTTTVLTTIYECPPSPVKEVYSYSKGVQTTEEWTASSARQPSLPEPENDEPPATTTPNKRLSRRERDKEEELREKIRKEIEEELQAAKELVTDGTFKASAAANFPARALTSEEMKAVTQSDEFMVFIDRSTKVIEKALDQEYDVLTDYTLQGHEVDEEAEEQGNVGGRGRRKVKEMAQFHDERWSKKRIISSIDFSARFSELVLASYTKNPSAPQEPDGIVQVWNMHMHDRAEFIFHAQSDILVAKFSPFHPNLIVGGTYSGQVLLWDTRARSAPVQKTPLTGSGHTHPVYAVDIVGTQNANTIMSCSTDGLVCGWSVDMFAQPQESLRLLAPQPPAKTEVVSPTCMAFPHADPTFFLVGTEEGSITPCHRYDRAGAKAGVDQRVTYKGHTAPVMSVHYHSARGLLDLSDLVLSSSLDWSVKLWKMRAPAATSGVDVSAAPKGSGLGEGVVKPLMEFVREDVVYDAAWSPIRPGVFALVDGAGWLELWDLTVETEEPVARVSPSPRKDGRTMLSKSLNKVAWDKAEGKQLATGGIDAALTLFEVGPDLGGKEGLKQEEWLEVRKLMALQANKKTESA